MGLGLEKFKVQDLERSSGKFSIFAGKDRHPGLPIIY
jgi:hypothetical protein